MTAIPTEVLALLSTRKVRSILRRSLRQSVWLRRCGYHYLPLDHDKTALRARAELDRREATS